MNRRRIFRELVSLERAMQRLSKHFQPKPLGLEEAPIQEAYGRVLAVDIVSPIDVPSFDRAAMDGYAVKAKDTFRAQEDSPRLLKVVGSVKMGEETRIEVDHGEAAEVGTGGSIPKGANAVVMVEYTERNGDELKVYRPMTPAENVTASGSDIMSGELTLRKGTILTPRELGVLSAMGLARVKVFTKPRVAIISTGDELVEPGWKLDSGKVYDINSASVGASVIENGGEPILMGVVGDSFDELRGGLEKAVSGTDCVITSGSTSAGAGDRLYMVVDDMGKPGIVVHGLSFKPGKPAFMAVVRGKPIFGLPGYPSSALIIFQVLVKPVLRAMAGLRSAAPGSTVHATFSQRVFSTKGRRELFPVHLVSDAEDRLSAFPIHSGSGAITSFALADGFIDIPEEQAFVDEGDDVEVTLLTPSLRVADFVFMGSHCVGVDILLRMLVDKEPQFTAKAINIGSTGGCYAVAKGESDVAGVHLLDEVSGEYNLPFIRKNRLEDRLILIRGYTREQGLVVARGNPKKISGFKDLLREDVSFINRNPGSGTRILLDLALARLAQQLSSRFEELASKIRGYDVEVKSHSAIASAVLNGRADVGLAINTVAIPHALGFIPVAEEHYDFALGVNRLKKPSVGLFLSILASDEFKARLAGGAPGLKATEETGKIIWPL